MIKVTAAVLFKDGKVLIARRKPEGYQPLFWEFPGGKVHEGESPEECLVREIQEELGISIKVMEPFETVLYEYTRGKIELMAYRVEWLEGEISLNAHAEYRWVKVTELGDYELSPADVPIARKLYSDARKQK